MSIKTLLVEDSELAAVAATFALTQHDFEVEVAETGDKGLQMAIDNKYDCIFMDFGLGETDGAEVTKNIRAQSQLNVDTPIIALTAHAEDDIRQKCLASGMNDFLTKPLNQEKIDHVLNTFFAHSRSAYVKR